MNHKSDVKTWIDAILHEDGDKLSDGSIRTLNLIKRELDKAEYIPKCPYGESCHTITHSCPSYQVMCPRGTIR
jgi:hypothetical protein